MAQDKMRLAGCLSLVGIRMGHPWPHKNTSNNSHVNQQLRA